MEFEKSQQDEEAYIKEPVVLIELEEHVDFEGLDWNANDFEEDTRIVENNYEQD